MGVYLRGEAITIVERFWTIDPVTEVATLADPTTVTFTVEAPDGTQTVYVYGVDGNVTRDSQGVYLCALAPPLPAGVWPYRCDGTGAVKASAEGTFTVLESGVLPPTEKTVPTAGPCNDWIYGSDVAALDPKIGVGSNTFELDDVASMASSVMYELSGRQFPGICERLVRPCANACGCWGDISSGGGPWVWSSFYGGVSWGWWNDQGGSCGCDPLSEVKLAGYPIRNVLEVKIDGVALPEVDTNGDRNWRLDRNRRLVRMDSPVDGRRFWPGCQNLSLDDTEMGTFSVSYRWGMEPPALGKAAAAIFAREIYKAISGDSTCKLPTKVTKVVRQGVTYDKMLTVAAMLRQGSSGIQAVDTFIATSNPTNARRRPAVWTPDTQRYARETG